MLTVGYGVVFSYVASSSVTRMAEYWALMVVAEGKLHLQLVWIQGQWMRRSDVKILW